MVKFLHIDKEVETVVFASLEFLFFFLPLSLIVCLCCPDRFRNTALFLLSIIFYAYGEPVFVILMLFEIMVNYFIGLAIGRKKDGKAGKAWLIAGVVFDLSLLFVFKYANWLITSFSGGEGIKWLALPIGISFYTFQIISYLADVYRGDCKEQTSFIRFGTYISMFPQLIAGPIVKYREIEAQLSDRKMTFEKAASGMTRFIAGLGKKVLIANAAGAGYELLAENGTGTTLSTSVGMLLFAFQIYFDFSAYSDMAIGVGRILGFEFNENFNYPYESASVSEFWRRWHISLSTWFRDYVYIPLGGNRKGTARTVLNLLIVWTLTGIWHGADITFLLWGLYYGILISAEKLFLGRFFDKHRALGRIWTLVAVFFGWIIFASTPSGFLSTVAGIFGANGFASAADLYDVVRFLPLIAVCAVGSTRLPKKLYEKAKDIAVVSYASVAALLFVIFLSAAYLVNDSFNPFLYFRF